MSPSSWTFPQRYQGRFLSNSTMGPMFWWFLLNYTSILFSVTISDMLISPEVTGVANMFYPLWWIPLQYTKTLFSYEKSEVSLGDFNPKLKLDWKDAKHYIVCSPNVGGMAFFDSTNPFPPFDFADFCPFSKERFYLDTLFGSHSKSFSQARNSVGSWGSD